MSEFDDRVRDSEAVSNLRQSVEMLPELMTREWKHYRVIGLVDRLDAVGKNVLSRLTLANRNLVSEQILNELA